MLAKLLVGIALGIVSASCVAQVVPTTTYRTRLSTSLGGGMNYWSGDWNFNGEIHRWGPSAWATLTVWHDLSIIAEGHSMILGGNTAGYKYNYAAGGGGLIYTSDYWGRFQPFIKGEAGFGSLTHPPNSTGHLHDTSNIWTLGGGFEYHNAGHWWTRVGYSYDFFPNFHSGITGQNHALNPRGFTFGETYRFGPSGSRF
jgi:opacity protein-like surface antigen